MQYFLWHEGEGNRGSNEIGSCILRYLDFLKNAQKITDECCKELDIIFYSDNCCGQQKNKYLLAMHLYIVNIYKWVNSITHKFLIAGHSQNEGDNVHSVIEKQVTRAKKSGPIFVPEQYVTLIRCAKKTGTPYKVCEINHEDIYDLKELAADMNFSNNLKDSDGNTFKISEVKVLKVEQAVDGLRKFLYKTSYEQREFKVVEIKSRKNSKIASSITLEKAYPTKLQISDKKKEGILSLFPKKLVPNMYLPFYSNL